MGSTPRPLLLSVVIPLSWDLQHAESCCTWADTFSNGRLASPSAKPKLFSMTSSSLEVSWHENQSYVEDSYTWTSVAAHSHCAFDSSPDYRFMKSASLGFVVLKALEYHHTVREKEMQKWTFAELRVGVCLLLTYRCWVRKWMERSWENEFYYGRKNLKHFVLKISYLKHSKGRWMLLRQHLSSVHLGSIVVTLWSHSVPA